MSAVSRIRALMRHAPKEGFHSSEIGEICGLPWWRLYPALAKLCSKAEIIKEKEYAGDMPCYDFRYYSAE